MSTAASCTGQLEPSLLRLVLKRGGITEDREGWRAPDGRRTTAVNDAFVGRSNGSRTMPMVSGGVADALQARVDIGVSKEAP